jgi:hypothetical protein
MIAKCSWWCAAVAQHQASSYLELTAAAAPAAALLAARLDCLPVLRHLLQTQWKGAQQQQTLVTYESGNK